MAIFKTHKQDIRQIFEFASGENPFDCIDVQSNTKDFDLFAFLTAPGSYMYRTRLIVDDNKAALLGVMGLRIEFFDADAEKFNVTDNNLLGQHDITFDTQSIAVKNIASINKNMKITADVFADSAMKVYAANIKATSNLDKITLPKSAGSPQAKSLKEASDKAQSEGQDPALLSSRGYPYTQTAESASSLDSKNNPVAFTFPDNRIVDESTSQKISLRNLRQRARSDKRSSYDNEVAKSHNPFSFPEGKSSNSSIKAFDFLPAKRLVQRDIHLSKERVGIVEKIFIKISAITKNTEGVTQKVFTEVHEEIKHSDQVSRFLRYPEPPEVEIESVDFSSVVFRLTKTDPMLGAVKIVKIVQNPMMPEPRITDAGIFRFDQNVIRVTQTSDNLKPNSVTYRFCAVIGNDTVGEFTSVVVPTFKKVLDPLDSVSVPFSVMAQNTPMGAIQIRTRVHSDDVESFRLLRQEFGKLGDFSDSITTVRNMQGHYETIVDNNSKVTSQEFLLFDDTAELGHKYRYFVAYRLGKISKHTHLSVERLSDEEDIITCRYVTESVPFILEIDASEVTLDENKQPTVTVSTSATEKEDFFPAVIDALTTAGVSGDFISKIQANTIKAKEFIMFLIERFDTATGRRESFGVRPPGDFTDNADQRQKFGVSELVPGRTYYYTAKACLQDPSVFFQKTNVSIVTRLGNLIPREAARFTRKIRESLGVLPSEAEIRNGLSLNDLILESQIGFELEAKVDYQRGIPQISTPTITASKEFTDISWSLIGERTEQVSYFNVFCTLQGEKNLLGSIAAHPETSEYRFRDDTYNLAVGTKAYSITAVNYFHDEFITSKSIRKDKFFSVPENMLVGAVFGSFGSKQKIAPIGPSPTKHGALEPIDMSTPPGIPGTPGAPTVEIGPIDFNPSAVSSLNSMFNVVTNSPPVGSMNASMLPAVPISAPLNALSLMNSLDPSPLAQNRVGAASAGQASPAAQPARQVGAQQKNFDPANQLPSPSISLPFRESSQNSTEQNAGTTTTMPFGGAVGGFSF